MASPRTDKVAKLTDGLLRSAYLRMETLISGINAGPRGEGSSQIVFPSLHILHAATILQGADPHTLIHHRVINELRAVFLFLFPSFLLH